MFFVFINWRAIVRLRHAYFRSPEYTESFYARTLIVHRVPKPLQSDEGLKSLFASLSVPYPATSVHIARRVGRLPELIKYHNDAVRELEAVLVRYLKGGKIASNRPTVTIGGFFGMGGTKKVCPIGTFDNRR
jgi:calcium permeable stress-gated cation channel